MLNCVHRHLMESFLLMPECMPTEKSLKMSLLPVTFVLEKDKDLSMQAALYIGG